MTTALDPLSDLAPLHRREAFHALGVLREFYAPEALFLFGSVAKGTGTATSDIDLLMRVADSPVPRRTRGGDFRDAMVGRFPRCDLVVFTTEEVEHHLANPRSFLSSVMVRARPLVLRDPAREPLLRGRAPPAPPAPPLPDRARA